MIVSVKKVYVQNVVDWTCQVIRNVHTIIFKILKIKTSLNFIRWAAKGRPKEKEADNEEKMKEEEVGTESQLVGSQSSISEMKTTTSQGLEPIKQPIKTQLGGSGASSNVDSGTICDAASI